MNSGHGESMSHIASARSGRSARTEIVSCTWPSSGPEGNGHYCFPVPDLAPVVAVIGGGQLARMLAEPAAALGVPLRLLAEAEGVSAAQVIPDHEVGDYRDLDALTAVTRGCEVVTFDHEHVPTQHLEALTAAGVACRPGPGALVHAQDKAVMRERLAELGVPCPRNAVVASVADVEAFGFPCVLKTTRGGYDGKGVWFVHAAGECA